MQNLGHLQCNNYYVDVMCVFHNFAKTKKFICIHGMDFLVNFTIPEQKVALLLFYRRLVRSIGIAPDCCAGGRGS